MGVLGVLRHRGQGVDGRDWEKTQREKKWHRTKQGKKRGRAGARERWWMMGSFSA